jgi:hypothetical protein
MPFHLPRPRDPSSLVLVGALLLVLLGHLRLVVDPVLGQHWAVGVGVLVLGTALWITARSASDQALPLVVAALAGTGLWLRWGTALDLAGIKVTLRAWLQLDPGPRASFPWLLWGHIALGAALPIVAALSPRWRLLVAGCAGLCLVGVALVVTTARAAPARPRPPVGSCLEPAARMRERHGRLLLAWRRAALQDPPGRHLASDGRRYPMRLSGTCLRCHDPAGQFCGSCHASLGINPGCLSCHVPPEGR